MNKVINISSNGIKQAIDDLVNENEMLQDKVYKLENIINELEKIIINEEKEYGKIVYISSQTLLNKIKELKGDSSNE